LAGIYRRKHRPAGTGRAPEIICVGVKSSGYFVNYLLDLRLDLLRRLGKSCLSLPAGYHNGSTYKQPTGNRQDDYDFYDCEPAPPLPRSKKTAKRSAHTNQPAGSKKAPSHMPKV
jgi:hypothetical protein